MVYGKRGLFFEWDQEKAKSNRQKHGYSFEQVVEIFFDPHRTLVGSRTEPHSEVRYKILGMIDNEFAVVIFTKRNGRIRIISGRKAHKNERKKYRGLQA